MSQTAFKEMQLRPVEDVATTSLQAKPAGVIEQLIELAKDPAIDVAKIEKLIDANERVMRIQAKVAFDAAFSEMQGELPTITERGEILVNGTLRSKYARYEDIVEVLRPILSRHGFAIRHRNEAKDGTLTIVGILSHRGGHSEEDRFECPPDTSGGKVGIQAHGSTRSYGQRYTTIALTGIVTSGQDDDGKAASRDAEPDGFAAWFVEIAMEAERGYPALKAAWEKAQPKFRAYATKHYRQIVEKNQERARAVKA